MFRLAPISRLAFSSRRCLTVSAAQPEASKRPEAVKEASAQFNVNVGMTAPETPAKVAQTAAPHVSDIPNLIDPTPIPLTSRTPSDPSKLPEGADASPLASHSSAEPSHLPTNPNADRYAGTPYAGTAPYTPPHIPSGPELVAMGGWDTGDTVSIGPKGPGWAWGAEGKIEPLQEEWMLPMGYRNIERMKQ